MNLHTQCFIHFALYSYRHNIFILPYQTTAFTLYESNFNQVTVGSGNSWTSSVIHLSLFAEVRQSISVWSDLETNTQIYLTVWTEVQPPLGIASSVLTLCTGVCYSWETVKSGCDSDQSEVKGREEGWNIGNHLSTVSVSPNTISKSHEKRKKNIHNKAPCHHLFVVCGCANMCLCVLHLIIHHKQTSHTPSVCVKPTHKALK